MGGISDTKEIASLLAKEDNVSIERFIFVDLFLSTNELGLLFILRVGCEHVEFVR